MPSRRGQGGRPINSGSSGSTTHLSAASIAVLNEIGSMVWKKEEPQSFTKQYTQTPGPTSLDVTGDSTPFELFCRFFSDDVWDLIKEETNRYTNTCTVSVTETCRFSNRRTDVERGKRTSLLSVLNESRDRCTGVG